MVPAVAEAPIPGGGADGLNLCTMYAMWLNSMLALLLLYPL